MQEFQPKDLSINSVINYWEQRSEIFKCEVVDLGSLVNHDSSAMAFLVQFAKTKPNMKLILKNTPQEVKGLIKMFRLEDLFILQD